MESIQQVLSKRLVINQSSKKINIHWEEAEEFGKYVGLKTIFVLKLFRLYGKQKVLGIRSWLKDVPYDPKRGGLQALAIWKLKQLKP